MTKRHEYNLYDDLENIKEAVADATQHAKGKATEYIFQSVADVKEKTTDLKDSVTGYVNEKPFKSLGIALLTGFCLGYLLRKK